MPAWDSDAAILHGDIHMVGLMESSACDCGENNEDVEHYLLECEHYTQERHDMMNKLFFTVNLTM